MTHRPLTSTLAIFAISAVAAGGLYADVKPNPLFSEGAVLQRGQAVPVWGTARDGEKVTVTIGRQKLTTTAVKGVWRVILEPLAVGEPLTMTFVGDNTVTVNHILVGEVWVCSGQSNMEFQLDHAANAAEETPKAIYPKIRMFTVAKTTSMLPLAEVQGSWEECSPARVGKFSAVGYFFARDLYQKLGIPVGMIHSSWGGTPAQAWTSLEGLGADPELKSYSEAAKSRLENFLAAEATYQVQLSEFKVAKKTWQESVNLPYQEALKVWTEQVAAAKAANQALPVAPLLASPEPTAPAVVGGNQNSATTLFNGMLNPLIPYAIKGAIWYQGEANAPQARLYRNLFPAMIADWRARWHQGNFPFLFVQIAPYNGQPPEIREAQLLTLAKSQNTAMAVTTDVGQADDIHPTRKEPVGQRLALAARALAYGEKVEYSGPLYQSMKIKGGKIVLSFTHLGGGLVAKDGVLKGFTIAAADGKFVAAKAEIEGQNVIVAAEEISEPKAVRYGWANVPDVNLFNQQGIPASPFRTDVD